MAGFIALLWGGVVAFIVWMALKSTMPMHSRRAMMEKWAKWTPLEIAKKRYARGEITLEEYEQIKKTLTES